MANNNSGRTFWDYSHEHPIITISAIIVLLLSVGSLIYRGYNISMNGIEQPKKETKVDTFRLHNDSVPVMTKTHESKKESGKTSKLSAKNSDNSNSGINRGQIGDNTNAGVNSGNIGGQGNTAAKNVVNGVTTD